jgi:iron complex transport system substrate-binding protein
MMDYRPQRIVSLQPSATVILAAIGEVDRLIACTKYCLDVCIGLQDNGKIIVADSWTAHSEQIIAAHPDLVIAAVPYQEKAVAEILKAGSRFLGLAPKCLRDIYSDIACIAGVVGKSIDGDRVIADMQQEIESIRQKSRGRSRARVFCEEWGKPLIASQPWVAELIEAAGGEFCCTPGATTEFAAVAQANPDVLIAAWCGAGDRVPLEKIVRDRGWQNIDAVRNGRVHCIRDEYLNTPAPTLLHGLRALAWAIHPECFPQPEGIRTIRNTKEVRAT